MRICNGSWLASHACVLLAGVALASQSPTSVRAEAAKGDIKIGNIAPYSGPASSYSAFAKTEAAYMKMLNDKGGINGRRIQFISYDDAYSPPKAVEQARKLVEQDEVLAIFQAVGTPSNAAMMKYMNAKKVPQLFSATGATKFGDPRNFPWTMGFSPSVYRIESAIYAKHILANYPEGKVAVLFPNDDYGRDIYGGFKDALGAKSKTVIIAEASYDSTEPTIDSQISKLKASGADIFVNFSTPRFGALAIRKVAELGWKPVHFINTTASSIPTVFKPAGLENAVGVMTAQAIKEPNDPRNVDDPGVKEYLDFMKRYNPDGDVANAQNAYGFLASQVLQKVLEQCGDDLSRDNVMKQATNLKNLKFGLLFDGITINTSSTNYFPIIQMQLIRFNGESFDKVGPIMSETVIQPEARD
ncbi:branched-chain amino acid ABC transporter substrate-binding protein [Bradyrhizobium sp. NAS80.1]|uniref:ABC transporter substrate-binding protein n=1 Tax=Bradyrhizobium sp. NAS80.1 TaxID=1680159 RepID=UPI00095B5388|nr:ABC transporter substrate-binding protein [Bradyrhizobium sp. NAS80.1]OKO84453.1 branched-chain amino acid ABC transporter substrate-binding protein [Bradyrhizobium sp. NAS80.1]